MSNSLTKQQKTSISLLASGTFLEYFDFMLYIHMAVLLNDLFFPKTNPLVVSLLAAFTFCGSYFFRTIGAYIFGKIGDKYGRKSVVILTNTFMAVACLVMAILPTYDEIGIAASILMCVCRATQSMSSLAELLGSQIYLLESVRQRPLQYSVVSSMAIFSSLGAVGALGFATLLFYFDLSWRLAFWMGTIIAFVSFFARIKLAETSDFLNSQKTGTQLLDSLNLNKKDRKFFTDSAILNNTLINPTVEWKTILSYSFIEAPYALFSFLAIIYASTMLKDQFNYTPEQIIRHNLYVVLIDVVNYITIAFLTYKIYPLLLFRTRLIIFIIFSLCIPFLLDAVATPYDLMFIQAAIMFLMPTSAAGSSIFHSHIAASKRFRYVAMTFAISRTIIYIVSSLGMLYLIKYFGYKGILFISVPLLIGTFIAVERFFQLEREEGRETKKWFNEPYIYRENFLKPFSNKLKKSRGKEIKSTVKVKK